MRHLLLASAFASVSFMLSGCAQAPEPTAEAPAAPATADKGVQRATTSALKPLDKKKFGAEITEKNNTPLDSLLKDPGKYSAQIVRTEGVVSAVCQGMGCWMEIVDTQGQAHIKMAGHSFFVPKHASGHRAVIQGKVLGSDKDHCAEEAEQATGKVAKVQIEATGVEFID